MSLPVIRSPAAPNAVNPLRESMPVAGVVAQPGREHACARRRLRFG